MAVRSFEVIVSERNKIEGYDIIEVGNNFEFSFLKYNIVSVWMLNKLLDYVTNRNDRLVNEVIQEATKQAKILASSKGWNCVLNFNLRFERLAEFASINCVKVIVSGTVCNLTPRQQNYQSTSDSNPIPGYSKVRCGSCGNLFTCRNYGYFRCPRCGAAVQR